MSLDGAYCANMREVKVDSTNFLVFVFGSPKIPKFRYCTGRS